MLSRFLLLVIFLNSTSSMAASVSTCVRNPLELLPVVYLDLNSKLSSFSILKRQRYCDDGLAVIEENQDLSISILFPDNGVLNKLIIDDSGEFVSGEGYSALDFEFNQKHLMNGIPYLYSSSESNVMLWDSELGSWKDVAATIGLPEGDYDDVSITFRNKLYFSISGAENNGVWELNETSKRVSVNSFGDVLIAPTPNGIAELIGHNNEYAIHWWDIPGQPKDLGFMPEETTLFKANSKMDGTLYQLQGTGFLKLIWDPVASSIDQTVEYPSDARYFSGCFSSRSNILCAFTMFDGSIKIYDLVGDTLKLESQILAENAFTNETIIVSLYAVGKSRFITTREGSIYSLYELNPHGLIRIKSYTASEPGQMAGVYYSRNPAVFYWVQPFGRYLDLYKAQINGDLAYQRIYEEPEPEPESKAPEVEQVEEAEESENSSAQASTGSLNIWLVMSLFGFFIRKKTTSALFLRTESL